MAENESPIMESLRRLEQYDARRSANVPESVFVLVVYHEIKCFTNRDEFNEALEVCTKKGTSYSGFEFETVFVSFENLVEVLPVRYYNQGTSKFWRSRLEEAVLNTVIGIGGFDAVITWPSRDRNPCNIPLQFCRR